MEKHYEKPEAQVVRYRKRVKTYAEQFTDSSGVQQVSLHCDGCNQAFFTAKADDTTITPEQMIAAWEGHLKGCPNPPHNP